MSAHSEGYNDGLDRAALHLQRKADSIRSDSNTTADFMARIFEELASEITALKKAQR